MCAEAERIANKPFKTSIDVRADDFDRETVDRANLANQVEDAHEAAAVGTKWCGCCYANVRSTRKSCMRMKSITLAQKVQKRLKNGFV